MISFLFDLFHIFPFLETFTESETTASSSECFWGRGGGLGGVWLLGGKVIHFISFVTERNEAFVRKHGKERVTEMKQY